MTSVRSDLNPSDTVWLAVFGALAWAAGTMLFRSTGHDIFEGTPAAFWANVLATPVFTFGLLCALTRLRGLSVHALPPAALAFVLPGMLGEVLVLMSFRELMTSMRPETAGRYAAFLFAGYTMVFLLSLAARRWATLRAVRPSTSG